jgi:hypothetical protein
MRVMARMDSPMSWSVAAKASWAPGEHRFAHAVVVEGDQRVGVGGKFCEGVVGLLAAAFPFEGEGHGRDNHHKGACLAGDARDGWRGARSRAAAEADANKDKLMAVETAAQ